MTVKPSSYTERQLKKCHPPVFLSCTSEDVSASSSGYRL